MKYHFFCFFFIAPCTLQAQATLWFHQLGKEDGILNSANINTVFRDSEGFVWIGTESGLNRFDGHSIVQYYSDISDSTTLEDNRVYGNFFEDKQKNIWFCTNGAIQCYLRKFDQFKSFHVRDSRGLQITSGYQAIHLERDSLLWIRADGRTIHTFDIHSREPSRPLAKTSLDIDIFPGTSVSTGRLHFLFSVDGSKSKGLEFLEFDASTKLVKDLKYFDGKNPAFPSLHVHTVHFDDETATWLATDSGIYKWDFANSQLESFKTGNTVPKFIAPFGHHQFIVSELNTRLLLFDKRTGGSEEVNSRLIDIPQLDIRKSLSTPYIDPRGNIWVLLEEEGVIYSNFQKIKFKSIAKFSGIDEATNYSFRSMVSDPKNGIWCSTFYHGIFLLDNNGKVLRHYHPRHPQYNSLSTRQINHMLMDKSQQLWIATDKGVSFFDNGTERFIPIEDVNGKKIDYVVHLHQLRGGDILASSLQNGIFRIARSANSYYLQQVYVPTDERNYFTTIYEDKLGSIYISSKMSKILVFNYSEQQLRYLTSQDIKGYINGVHEDIDGTTLWFATSSGLVQIDKSNLDKKHILFTNKVDGLSNNEIQSLTIGQDENLWMGTSGSLSRFNLKSLEFENFTSADGTQSTRFNAMAVLNHNNGTLWFGGENGLTIVEPTNVPVLDLDAKVQITEIKVNDEVKHIVDPLSKGTNVTYIDNIIIPYQENTLSFSFVPIDYSDPSSTLLEYMMEGVDHKWVRLKKGEPGFARYPNLPPSDYTFKIRAANSDGKWSKEIRQLSIKVKPPWFQTWWARTLFFLLFASLLYVLYRIRIKQIRKEAEHKQQIAEIETAVLRLQMNPHFIFNSMNSISSYILQKDIDTANTYLNRFANLMRKVLKLAKRPFLAVSQEIDLLKQYLDTEAMRFEDKINYEIHVDEELDPEELIIPTMIMQPFVENAIWHGLARKKGTKKILIKFRQEGAELICSIQDNGIGRAKAKLNKPQNSPHDSKATAITHKRLQLLKEQKGVDAQLKIIDLSDNKGRSIGTKVIISLPIL